MVKSDVPALAVETPAARPRRRKVAAAAEAALAALLLWSCYLPWLVVMGAPVPAHRIREQLEGPHRLASLFSQHSRISFDYSISLGLRVLPLMGGVLLLVALVRLGSESAGSAGPLSGSGGRRGVSPLAAGLQTWLGLACGAAALAAYLYLRGEAEHWAFVRIGYGAGLAAVTGGVLAATAVVKWVTIHRLSDSSSRRGLPAPR